MGCCPSSSAAGTFVEFTDVNSHASAAPDPHRFRKIDVLLASIASGAVRPLRGSYVIELAKSRAPLKRRQDLPDRAFFDHTDLLAVLHKLRDKFGREDTLHERGPYEGEVAQAGGDWRFMLLLHALSYRWITKDHPDPECHHLLILADVAEARIHDEATYRRAYYRESLWKEVFEPIGAAKEDVDFAIFWDFASLYQTDRTRGVDDRSEPEVQLFKGALAKGGALNVWYGHLHTTVWIQSELPVGFAKEMGKLGLARTYKESGWCHVESVMSTLLKPKERRLDLGMRHEPAPADHYTGYERLTRRCAVGREPPLPPQTMSRVVRTEKRFTGTADCEVVDAMYGDFFAAAAPTVSLLLLRELGWGAAEGCALAAALPRFPNCRKMDLRENPLGDVAGKAIGEAVGSMPALSELRMGGCQVGDGTAAALAHAISRSSTLTDVHLQCNRIGDAGGLALAEAIGGNTTLQSLWLNSCEKLGKDAKAALEKASRHDARADNPLDLCMDRR